MAIYKMSATLSRNDALRLLLLTAIWGLNWPIMKLGVSQIPPFTFRTVTIIGGLLTLAVGVRLQGHRLAIGRADRGEMLRLALTNTAGWFVLSILGVTLVASGRAAILAYTLPVWVALIGAVAYGERHGPRLGIALAAALVGVLLLLGAEIGSIGGSPTGTLLLLASAIVWAIGTHQLRRRRSKMPVIVLTFWMTVVALVVCVALALVFEWRQPLPRPDAAGVFSVVYNAIFAYGVAQVLWFRLASQLPPVVSALSVMMIPVLGVLSGQWLLGERAGWTDYTALVAILIAIATTLLPARRS